MLEINTSSVQPTIYHWGSKKDLRLKIILYIIQLKKLKTVLLFFCYLQLAVAYKTCPGCGYVFQAKKPPSSRSSESKYCIFPWIDEVDYSGDFYIRKFQVSQPGKYMALAPIVLHLASRFCHI